MKKTLKLAAPLMSLMALVLPVVVAPIVSAAGSGTLSLSPSSGTYKVGDTFSVAVHENSGSTAAYAVQANLSYSTSKLTYVSYTDSASFSFAAESPDSDSGLLKFARGSTTGRTGDRVVVTVKFKAKATASATDVTFASGSVIADGGGGDILGSSQGGTYKINAVASSPPPSPPPASPSSPPPSSGGSTSGSGSSSGGSSSSGSSSSKDTSAPKISGVSVSDATASSVTISWQTSEPATSEVSYGLSAGKRTLSTSDPKLVTAHKLVLSSYTLAPGTNYHYVIRSADARGNVATSQDAIFATVASSAAAASSKSDNTKLMSVIGAIAMVTFLAIIGTVAFRHMHHSQQEKAELARHFPDNFNNKPPQGPIPPTIFTPNGNGQ